MNLYRVLICCYGDGKTHYVVAEDPQRAYETVRSTLKKECWGVDRDRELESVTLVASLGQYPTCGTRLHTTLPEEST